MGHRQQKPDGLVHQHQQQGKHDLGVRRTDIRLLVPNEFEMVHSFFRSSLNGLSILPAFLHTLSNICNCGIWHSETSMYGDNSTYLETQICYGYPQNNIILLYIYPIQFLAENIVTNINFYYCLR